MIEGARDYLLAHQMPFSDLKKKGKWTSLVKFIRVRLELVKCFGLSKWLLCDFQQESHPLAWPGVRGELRDPAQVGKIVQRNLERIIKLRRERRTFVRNSGNIL